MIAWDDAEIGIDWPLADIGGAAAVQVSDKDRAKAVRLRDAEVFA